MYEDYVVGKMRPMLLLLYWVIIVVWLTNETKYVKSVLLNEMKYLCVCVCVLYNDVGAIILCW